MLLPFHLLTFQLTSIHVRFDIVSLKTFVTHFLHNVRKHLSLNEKDTTQKKCLLFGLFEMMQFLCFMHIRDFPFHKNTVLKTEFCVPRVDINEPRMKLFTCHLSSMNKTHPLNLIHDAKNCTMKKCEHAKMFNNTTKMWEFTIFIERKRNGTVFVKKVGGDI